MKYIFKQLAVLIVVASVALLVATVSARQVTTPPALTANFDGNTPTPINTGTQFDVKGNETAGSIGGGLAVNAFIAFQNASFLKRVDLEGILTGGDDATIDSTLSFGDPSKVTNTGGTDITRIVDLTANGSIYTEDGGLYNKEKGANAKLCADPNGVIVLCEAAPPTPSGKLVVVQFGTFDAISSTGTVCSTANLLNVFIDPMYTGIKPGVTIYWDDFLTNPVTTEENVTEPNSNSTPPVYRINNQGVVGNAYGKSC